MFGVISIHNMPILDAIARHNRIRFVPARGEAGAMNMADAYARVCALARRRHHQHRNGGRERRGLAGRGAHRRLAGAAHHLPDRPRPTWTAIAPPSTTCRGRPTCCAAVSKAYFRVWEGRTAVGMSKRRRGPRSRRRADRSRSKSPSTCSAKKSRARDHVGIGPIAPQAADPTLLDALAALVRRPSGRCCGSAAARARRARRRSIWPNAASRS